MRRILLMLVVSLGGGVLAATPGTAQRVTFVGAVYDSLTGSPVQGATVAVPAQGILAQTGAEGRFRLPGIRAGAFTLLVEGIGYRPGALDLELTAIRAAEVDLGTIMLSPLVAQLDPVVVTGEPDEARLTKVGFFSRMHTEAGTFVTSADIEALHPSRTSEVFRRIPGFRVLQDGSVASARGAKSMSQAFTLCEVQYFIDGVHAAAPDVDVVIPTSISGIEVYSGSSSIPPMFRGTGNPHCGVVVIWTRDGGPARER